uniref:Secreted protein n=1 Tax=Anguilla anguilla TaxID=7936 RepID=A0A0E9WN00_ANGAN
MAWFFLFRFFSTANRTAFGVKNKTAGSTTNISSIFVMENRWTSSLKSLTQVYIHPRVHRCSHRIQLVHR